MLLHFLHIIITSNCIVITDETNYNDVLLLLLQLAMRTKTRTKTRWVHKYDKYFSIRYVLVRSGKSQMA